MSELLIDGKENFECACCHNVFDCDNAVMLKDNLNDEFFVCPNCYTKIANSYFCSMEIEITRS
jgi:hypothetical protein